MNRIRACVWLLAVSMMLGLPSIGYAVTPSESVLYAFGTNMPDGEQPQPSLIMDSAGNLYGTTSSGGTYDDGTVFEIEAGTHVETVLYSFRNNIMDGQRPLAGLIMDTAGNIYGTTSSGGPYDSGTVFEIATGTHQETILHLFGTNDDGFFPESNLIMDSDGNFYGTTNIGGSNRSYGANGVGTVFEIAAGTHQETVLYSFGANSTDGEFPSGDGLTMDSAGNLGWNDNSVGYTVTVRYLKLGQKHIMKL